MKGFLTQKVPIKDLLMMTVIGLVVFSALSKWPSSTELLNMIVSFVVGLVFAVDARLSRTIKGTHQIALIVDKNTEIVHTLAKAVDAHTTEFHKMAEYVNGLRDNIIELNDEIEKLKGKAKESSESTTIQ